MKRSADREREVHREWLGLLQPVGVVVSPTALVSLGFVPEKSVVDIQLRLRDVTERAPGRGPDEPERVYIADLPSLLVRVLGWQLDDLRGKGCAQAVSDEVEIVLPNYGETLRPTWSVHDPMEPSRTLLLIQQAERGADLDAADEGAAKAGWHASPHAKFERLLSESKVRVGLLTNGELIRLVHTPEHQTSGHLTFPVRAMGEVAGRPILAAFDMLLRETRVFSAPQGKSLFDVLQKSRDYQNDVSNKLAEQVLHALWELLRGFQAADEQREGKLLAVDTPEDRDHVYGGHLTALMRMVFLLYAEDQGLLPHDEVWVANYSVAGLHKRLRDDAALHPDTMDQRYGAWAALLALFRIVHNGGGHGLIRLPARKGQLFDPDAYPFLEGRPAGSRHDPAEKIDAPRVSDGCLFRVLEGLLVLDGERLSYRALDVEQIGSVYEAMMGYLVERMRGPSLAVKLRRKGIPGFVFVDVDELLTQPKRAKWLKDTAGCKLTGKAKEAIETAATPDDVFAALERRVSKASLRILPPGALVLQPGEERRRSGSHYTPRDLTQPIVRTTLRPVLEDLGPRPTPQEILDLKVCDPAMGSGAFLVEACRQLAEQLVTAWEVHGKTPEIPPDEDALLHAKRLVAQGCLYGVDKNPFAVNLAKLSLWLVTLARDHAFTFLDHALKCGDSLVGLTREQIAAFDWARHAERGFVAPLVEESLRRAGELRCQIQSSPESRPETELRALNSEVEQVVEDVRMVGDIAVGAFFAATKKRAREEQRLQRQHEVRRWYNLREENEAVRTLAEMASRKIRPFHWELEFPEVFTRETGGFDAIVGNPPFLGGTMISTQLGTQYRDWLYEQTPEARNRCDLVAYFLRRAFDLLRLGGAFGLIGSNTIAQGDTRAGGLRWICEHGGEIFAARKRVKWPGSAAVVVSVVHVMSGIFTGARHLDGRVVETITAFLFHRGGHDDPASLSSNQQRSFTGVKIYGQGFIFNERDSKGIATPLSEMRRLIEKDPRNGERIFPYIGGEEVNKNPTHAHHRYVIDFGEMSEADAGRWPDLLSIAERKVKPERATKAAEVAAWPWWRFWRSRRDLYEAISGVQRTLVTNCGATPHLAFAFQPPDRVFAHSLAVFPLSTYASFCTLQSRPHEIWARFFGSTMKDDLRYTPSDCFETFAFPEGWQTQPALEAAGQVYYEFRANLMIENDEGLTKTYNRFHDPDDRSPAIHCLRELHDAMDRAVLDAYGWSDIRPTCEFLLDYEIDEEEWGKKKKPYRYRWPDEIHDEVLGRLLELNKQRTEEERLAGESGRGRGGAGPAVRRSEQPRRVAERPLPLFDGVDEDGEER